MQDSSGLFLLSQGLEDIRRMLEADTFERQRFALLPSSDGWLRVSRRRDIAIGWALRPALTFASVELAFIDRGEMT